MVRFLEQRGFTVLRIRGSHHVMALGELHTTVPVHGNQLKDGNIAWNSAGRGVESGSVRGALEPPVIASATLLALAAPDKARL